jgi:hypothetical protein
VTTATKPLPVANPEASLRAAAYAEAERKLRDACQDQFQVFYKEACEARGIAYKPRLTAEQKAAKQIEDLYEKFPNLRPQPLIDFPEQ